jgi:hypothetical protein
MAAPVATHAFELREDGTVVADGVTGADEVGPQVEAEGHYAEAGLLSIYIQEQPQDVPNTASALRVITFKID